MEKHPGRFAAGIASLAVVLAGLTVLPANADGDGELGSVSSFQADGDTYVFASGTAKLRVQAEDPSLIRVQLAQDGSFTDPANDDPADPSAPDADIVVKKNYPGAKSTHRETADAYVISTSKARLVVTKSPLTLRLTDATGRTLMRETAPLSWSTTGTTQTLSRTSTEQFYGGGMQNGRFSHRDHSIDITRDLEWEDGDNPNAAPFYVSSNGYGVLRNTFAPGNYDYHAPVRTTHDEQRFDAYYFVGTMPQVINGYTELTGRPARPPMYGLELGDADCYLHNANRGERRTLRDSTAVAEGYRKNGLPLGWMLVNDGYGCGYEDLPETGAMLKDHRAELGLWTESDLTEQQSEVKAGVRVRKTDVAWVGPGYRFALDACEKAYDGIADNSTDRPMVITIAGWAGTQRCGATWSGDQSGSWDYIRWQIPTYAGATMSGQPVSTGDIDGIFGGSPKTYARDLQWKMMLPTTYAMNGWADSDKQPWRYGEAITKINKKYLLLHEQLLPYLDTLLADASRTGLGPTRPLVLNYPDDRNVWGDKVKYEFMVGKDLLVAPVYTDTAVRNGIYLPKGRWVDYWTGRVYEGGRTLNNYPAPLDTLPLFVRAGSTLPMFPAGTTDWTQGKKSGQLDLDVYPQGRSSFISREDDGRSRQGNAGARQQIRTDAPAAGKKGSVSVDIGALTGSYPGKPSNRRYQVRLHTDSEPSAVRAGSSRLTKVADADKLTGSRTGWAYDDESGVITVRTASVPTAKSLQVRVTGTTAVGGRHPADRQVRTTVKAAAIGAAGQKMRVTATVANDTGAPITLDGVQLDVPSGWKVQALESRAGTRLPDGTSTRATFDLTPAADASVGSYSITAENGYRVRRRQLSTSAQTETSLAHPDFAAALNNVGSTAEADPKPGQFDSAGDSFIAERLAAQNVVPGKTFSANGHDFALPDAAPGEPNNVTGTGQSMLIKGSGSTVAWLGSGSSTAAAGDVTVHYTDGSTSRSVLGFPNWCCVAPDAYGAKIAAETLGKNTPDGPAYPTTPYRLFTQTVAVDPSKSIKAITFPDNQAVHVWAVTLEK